MKNKKSYILGALAVILWSTLAPVAKLLIYDLPNLEVLAISSAFATVFLILLNVFTGNAKKFKEYKPKQYGIMALLGFFGVFLYSWFYYYGISQLGSQKACILNYLWPTMIVVFSCIILKEKMTVLKIVALICSFAGVIVLTMGSVDNTRGNIILGIGACLTEAVFYGLFSVLNKKIDYNQNISMVIYWAVAAIGGTVVGLITEKWVMLSWAQWLGMIWLGVVTNAIGYLFWAIAINTSKETAGVANLAYLVPFLSMILSALVLKEKVELAAIIALILIVGGILVQSLNSARKNKI